MSNIDLGFAIWRKSSRSASGTTGDCVEVAGRGHAVGVRDSKDLGGAALWLEAGQWRALRNRIKAGAFDLP